MPNQLNNTNRCKYTLKYRKNKNKTGRLKSANLDSNHLDEKNNYSNKNKIKIYARIYHLDQKSLFTIIKKHKRFKQRKSRKTQRTNPYLIN